MPGKHIQVHRSRDASSNFVRSLSSAADRGSSERRSARKSTVDHAANVMANFPNIEQRMEDSIKDLIANPSCLEDKRKNERTKMQIRIIEAVTYLSR